MNSKISATTSEKNKNHANPFSLLAEREEAEQARFDAALHDVQIKETEALAGIRDAEQREEEELRAAAKQELIAEREQASAMVRERRTKAEQAAADLRERCEKNIPGLAKQLAQDAVSFLSAA